MGLRSTFNEVGSSSSGLPASNVNIYYNEWYNCLVLLLVTSETDAL